MTDIAQLEADLAQQVKDGLITQKEADKIYASATNLVNNYLGRLEATLGTAAFDAVFDDMKMKLTRTDINAVASQFMSKTAKSAPKRESLQRIYSRHKSMIDSANKREWQKGKGAA